MLEELASPLDDELIIDDFVEDDEPLDNVLERALVVEDAVIDKGLMGAVVEEELLAVVVTEQTVEEPDVEQEVLVKEPCRTPKRRSL